MKKQSVCSYCALKAHELSIVLHYVVDDQYLATNFHFRDAFEKFDSILTTITEVIYQNVAELSSNLSVNKSFVL